MKYNFRVSGSPAIAGLFFCAGNGAESRFVRAAGERLKLECTFGYFLWFCGKSLTITDGCQGIVRNSKKRKKDLSVYL